MTPIALRILDPCAPRPYADRATLDHLGCTETTVLRIARALSGDVDVSVEQAARHTAQTSGRVRFGPMTLGKSAAGTIVVINSWDTALVCRRYNPRARILVWQHVAPGGHLGSLADCLADAGIEIVCVSRWLAAEVRRLAGAAELAISVISNPAADDLHPDRTVRDPNLLFCSSAAGAGLDDVLAAFERLRARIPDLRLELADPGHLDSAPPVLPDGAVFLGTLAHQSVISKMRKALCLFQPQTRCAETFSLAIAEANAVGCPALVHRGLGANDEIASGISQCIDASDPDMIAGRIIQWRRSSPRVTLDPRFRLSAVVRDWRQLLGTSQCAIAKAPVREVVHVA